MPRAVPVHLIAMATLIGVTVFFLNRIGPSLPTTNAHLIVGIATTYVIAWQLIVGLGMGVGFATAASAALKEVPSAQSGVASALLQAMQKVGAPFGSAVLGSVLVTVYQSHLNLVGLPAALASTVKLSVFAGDAVAARLHSPTLLQSVHYAFVQGMDSALLISAGIAGAAALLALIFLPGRSDVSAVVQPAVERVA